MEAGGDKAEWVGNPQQALAGNAYARVAGTKYPMYRVSLATSRLARNVEWRWSEIRFQKKSCSTKRRVAV